MKVIIDIPEDMYNDIQKYLTDNSQCYVLSDYELREVIRNGKSYKERPQGEWIEDIENLLYRCSNCNASSNIRMFKSNLHFCPNCGADMRGGRE